MRTTREILEKAKKAAQNPALSTSRKNEGLRKMAKALLAATPEILKANAQDVENARGKISEVMIDRLKLDESRIKGMADGMISVAELPDPVGRILSETTRENGLLIQKVAVPVGVTAIIYESRPNVTSDAAALSFKSGNVCVLRGGKEAAGSASAIVKALKKGLADANIDEDYVNLVEDTTRQSATELMTARGEVDLLIPRGGKGLIRACVENATVPCIETGTGICHIYVDAAADLSMALSIVENAKTSRPSVCNAAEVLLVNKSVADAFLPLLYERLCGKVAPHPVQLRGDSEVCKIIPATPAGSEDFDTEFLDYILAVKVVRDVKEAAAHIAEHSTHHSESIVTEDEKAANYFTENVDSAAVYVNASTRFTDGGEFGLGCEMGISTQKLHARGPMGLCELTTYKYVIRGNGQIR